jgi:D-aspartate ligase
MSIGAIVVGAHVNGLGVIRALGQRGVPIVAVSTRPFDIAQRSRWVYESHPFPEFHDRPDTLVEWLTSHASRWRGWAIFPTNDDALTVLAANCERLSTYTLTVQPWPIASQFVDKIRLHALATAAGLDVPHCYGPATAETAARSDLKFPVAVKPRQHGRLITRFGVKLFLARNPTELAEAIRQLELAGVDGLVFDFVAGPDSEIFVYAVYVDASGQASPGVTIRKLRQYPAGLGAACAAEVVAEMPALRDATLALTQRAGFRGMAFAEFKRDSQSGRMQFIEINGRTVLFNDLPRRAGLDLVNLAWDDFVLERPFDVATPHTSAAWVHVQADVLRALRARGADRPRLRDLAAPYFRGGGDAVFSWSDPAPFLLQTAKAAKTGCRRLIAALAIRRRETSPSPRARPGQAHLRG